MEHHGEKLKGIAKAKGFTIQALADEFGVTRTIVERNYKTEVITRKVLDKYAKVLGFDADEFYAKQMPVAVVAAPVVASENQNAVVELLREIIREKDERIKLLENQVRFFPNAAQPGIMAVA